MRIAGTTLQLEASSLRVQQHEVGESVTARSGAARPLGERMRSEPLPAFDTVDLSPAAQAAEGSEARAIEEGLDAVERDPMLRLIRALLGWLTGRPVKVFDGGELNSAAPEAAAASPDHPPEVDARPAAGGVELEYTRHESYREVEQVAVAASGVVRTSDGREVAFSLSLQMNRSYYAESTFSLRAGDAPRTKDPLVLNFAGSGAELTSRRFSFDLDADGNDEAIHLATGGSGFLALDRNGDGRINSGLELFGARSGDGFADLAALDTDGNGWIDAADAAYDDLRVWSRSEKGDDRLLGMAAAGVGALSVLGVSSPFALKTGDNALQGMVRSTGLYLREDGGAGTLQQVDLAV